MKIKENIDLSILEKYNFKKPREWIKETKVPIYDSKGEDYYFLNRLLNMI